MLQLIWVDAALAAALLLLWFRVGMGVRVKGNSMLPTLHSGDWLLVNRVCCRHGAIRRGDVVICHFPGRYAHAPVKIPLLFVKRVIGLPGETIAIEMGVVMINGSPLEESYLDPAYSRFKSGMPPRTLGAEEFFVMGDYRDHSSDSRRIGPLRRHDLVGRVEKVVFSPAKHRNHDRCATK